MRRLSLFVLVFLCLSGFANNPGDRPAYDGFFIVDDSYKQFSQLFGTGMESGYFYYEELVRKLLPEFDKLPYGAGNVSCPSDQTLVNFKSFDCVTFVETFWALMNTLYEFQAEQVVAHQDPFEVFGKNLNRIRYFGGDNCGMQYRIHYFTQQMEELSRSGLAFNVAMANGSRFWKKINYITENGESYGDLAESNKMKQLESILSRTPRYYYPLHKRSLYYPMAKDGDIIAFASKEPGLDVSHTGIITIVDGEPALNHASGKYERIVLGQDLDYYLCHRTKINGFFIYRPVFDHEETHASK